MSRKLLTMFIACGLFSFSMDLYSSNTEKLGTDNVGLGDLFQEQEDNDENFIQNESIDNETKAKSVEKNKKKRRKGRSKLSKGLSKFKEPSAFSENSEETLSSSTEDSSSLTEIKKEKKKKRKGRRKNHKKKTYF